MAHGLLSTATTDSEAVQQLTGLMEDVVVQRSDLQRTCVVLYRVTSTSSLSPLHW